MTDTPPLNRKVFIYQADIDGDKQDVVSIMDDNWVFRHGLCAEAILGRLRPPVAGDHGITPERFSPNPAFVQLLHQVIAEHISASPEIRREGKRQRDGYVYLLDGRTPQPGGQVPPEDIIGAVAVRGGSLVSGSYQPNTAHRLLTADGLFVLPPEIEIALQDEVRTRCAQRVAGADAAHALTNEPPRGR
jgi:hypothetical protein